MDHDSLDISQIKSKALQSPILVALNSNDHCLHYAPIEVSKNDSTSLSFVETSRTRFAEVQWNNKSNKVDTYLPGTQRIRMSNGTQKSGCTEPLSQWVYEPSARSVPSNRLDKQSDSAQGTYRTGETGHVSFEKLSSLVQDTIGDNDDFLSQEEIGIGAVSPVEIAKSAMPPSRTFVMPETPANNSRKRDYNGNLVDQTITTPQLPPVNPFANQIDTHDVAISISQAFDLTQAPSSPFTNQLPSELTSNKPTPGMRYGNRPSTAGASSSPAKPERASIQRSTTEPYTKWNSTQDNGFDLQNLSSPAKEQTERPQISDDTSFSDDGSDSSQIRLLRDRHKAIKARRQLSHIAAKQSFSNSEHRISKRKSQSTPSKLQIAHGKPQETVLISDGSVSSESGEETEREEVSMTSDPEDEDEPLEDNKENFRTHNLQTSASNFQSHIVARVARNIHVMDTTSPAIGLSEEIDCPEETVAETSSQRLHATSSTARPRSPIVQSVAIADSQTAPMSQAPKELDKDENLQLPTLGLSSGYENVIIESQTSKIPNTSEIGSSIVKKPIMHQLSQFSSSPLRAPAHRPDSSPPKFNSEKSLANRIILSGDKAKALPSSPPQPRQDSGRMTVTSASTEVQDRSNGEDPSPRSSRGNFAEPKRTNLSPHTAHSKVQGQEANAVDQITPYMNGKRTMFRIPETEPSARPQQTDSAMHCGHTNQPLTMGPRGSPFTNTSRLECDSSDFTDSPFKSQTKTQPKKSSQNFWRANHPKHHKTMKELAETSIPHDNSDDINLSFDILTKEDEEFVANMDQLSSPVRPGRKKRKLRPSTNIGYNGSTANSQANDTLAILSSQEKNQVFRSNDSSSVSRKQSPDRLEKENTSPLSTVLQNDPDSDTSSSEQSSVKDVGSRPSKNHKGRLQENLKITQKSKAMDCDKEAVTGRTLPISSKPQTQYDGQAKSACFALSSGTDHESFVIQNPKSGRPVPLITNSMRVFAFFNGSPLGYYPATCISIHATEPKYTVQFDDGSTSIISSGKVKRLELRAGDLVRVDRKGLRGTTFVVETVEDDGLSSQCEQDLTDIFGNTVVTLRARSRGVTKSDESARKFPIALLYYTMNMWASIKDRDPLCDKIDSGVEHSDLEAPSSALASSPSISNMRQRFAKVVSKQLVGQNHDVSINSEQGLFANFIFAMTSINDAHTRTVVENLIRSNGGRVLDSGFEALFSFPKPTSSSRASTPRTTTSVTSRSSTPASEISKLRQDRNVQTFELSSITDGDSPTLLVADRHSRNTKFFQALSLGIPCIHTRWVRDCTAKNQLTDWRPYLLGSGESLFLGGAVVSRWLPDIKDSALPSEWSIRKLVETRNKWLDKKHVLLVGAGAGGKMEAYVFIAYALGAQQVDTAKTREDAQRLLNEESNILGDEDGRRKCRWDWVCINEEEMMERDSRSVNNKKGKSSKKRKSFKHEQEYDKNTSLVDKLHGVKVVGTECVVQSLILGRLLEPNELENI